MPGEEFRRVVLDGCGSVDPESIDEYIAAGGYTATRQAIAISTPESIVARVAEAALLGRGGSGHPVADKWRIAIDTPAERKVVLANAYDADPLSPIGRTLLEQMPHRVLEGTIIAAYAVGASEGIIYCNGKARTAVHRLRRAIAMAEANGFLTSQAPGPIRALSLSVALGWSGFAGGEETAAIAAIEGRRAMPAQKPPYPAQQGIWGVPTVVHSAETLANLPTVIGVEASELPSTARGKVFAVRGSVKNTGLAEWPLGVSLSQMLEAAGGPAKGHKIKAAQIGGPTGAVIPARDFDDPLSFASLREMGTSLGSGRVEFLDETTCLAGFARDTMNYLKDEACGRCVPCRLGTRRMAGILEAITSGLGEGADPGVLEKLSASVSAGSICGFGAHAPNVVTSTLRHFREEYIEHVEKKSCPTGQCRPSRELRYRMRAVL